MLPIAAALVPITTPTAATIEEINRFVGPAVRTSNAHMYVRVLFGSQF